MLQEVMSDVIFVNSQCCDGASDEKFPIGHLDAVPIVDCLVGSVARGPTVVLFFTFLYYETSNTVG